MKRVVLGLVVMMLCVSAFAPFAATAGPTTDGVESADATTATDVSCEYPESYTDATGEEILLEESPETVVALQPSDAQTMFEIGAEDRLVGMPENPATDDLEMGDRTPISDGYDLIQERIVALNPDIVLAANTTQDDDIDGLRDAGLDVYVFAEGDSIEQLQENVLRTGTLVDECDGATDSVEWMDQRIALLESVTEDEDQPLVFYDLQGGYTAGAGSFHDDVFDTAGLENLGERLGVEGWGEVSSEDIVDEDPDWIIRPESAEFEFSNGVEETTAYAQGNVLVVDDNAMNQPAPQIVFVLEDIVAEIHAEAYAEVEDDLEVVDEEYRSGDTADGENDDEGGNDESGNDDTSDETDDAMSGFGISAATVALFGSTLLILRRR